jgi:CubicO group peptidase (beta-lactamase class C family)
MRRAALYVAFGSVIAASSARAQSAEADPVYARQIDSAIDAVRRDRAVPGVLVLIAKGGRPVYVRGSGYADVEHRTPFTAETTFGLASNTKQFTAVSILQLSDRGALGLDDDITKYVPELDTHGRHVSLRDLLRHTSGLSVVGTAEPGQFDRRYSTAEIVGLWAARSRTQLPAFEPGTAFQYRDLNFQLLGTVIERVSGTSLSDYFRAHLFGPASMRTAGPCEQLPGSAPSAVGYVMAGAHHDSLTIVAAQHSSWEMGAGEYCASAEDMLHWVRALHRGTLLAPATYQRMISPDTLTSGQRLQAGYGLFRWIVDGEPMLWHSGGHGYSSVTAYLPATDETFITFANADDDPWSFGTAVIHLVHGTVPSDRPATAASLVPFVGTYTAGNVSAVVRDADGHLRASVSGTNSLTFFFETRLLNQGNGTFVVGWEPGTTLVFDRSSAPSPRVLLRLDGRTLTLERR